jgi:hypothetical protein
MDQSDLLVIAATVPAPAEGPVNAEDPASTSSTYFPNIVRGNSTKRMVIV